MLKKFCDGLSKEGFSWQRLLIGVVMMAVIALWIVLMFLAGHLGGYGAFLVVGFAPMFIGLLISLACGLPLGPGVPSIPFPPCHPHEKSQKD